MKRTFMILAAGLALALTLGAAPAFAKPDCGENTGQKATGKPIPIGGVTSMSGIGSFKEAGDAAEAYFKCVNDNGGIHGRPITYHAEDDQSQLDVAAQAAKKLVEDEGVYVRPSSHAKCERCWHYRADVGIDAAHPTICGSWSMPRMSMA